MKKYLLLTLPAMAFAAPAFAQDAAPVGGLRIEATVGYDNIGVEDDDFTSDDPRVAQPGGDIDGAVFGGTIGYDFAMGPMMLGIDAEVTETTGDREFFAIVTGTTPRAVAQVDFGRDLYVGGRATFAMSETINAYVKAGYTNLRASLSVTDDAVQAVLDDLEDSDLDTNLDGIRGALGFAYSPEGRAYYGVEFRYSNYENGVDRKQANLVVGFRF
jgi:outer membrane immunogenic protein